MAILSVDFIIHPITRFCSCQLVIVFITLDYTAITAFMITLNYMDTKTARIKIIIIIFLSFQSIVNVLVFHSCFFFLPYSSCISCSMNSWVIAFVIILCVIQCTLLPFESLFIPDVKVWDLFICHLLSLYLLLLLYFL